MPRRTLFASLLILLAYVAGFFSLWIQVDPFSGAGKALPIVAAASGAAFAVAGHQVAGPHPPRGFALVGLGLCSAAAALALIVTVYG